MLSFRDLQNYTTLKRIFNTILRYASFRDLQNYTTLKRYSNVMDQYIQF